MAKSQDDCEPNLPSKWSVDKCHDFQLDVGLTDENYEKVRGWLADEVSLRATRIVADFRREEMAEVATELGARPILKRQGVMLDLRHAIEYIMKVLTPSTTPKTTKWKISIDGRQYAKRKEVMIGITPLSFGIDIQSCDFVFPIAIWEGTKLWSSFLFFLMNYFKYII